MIYFFNTHLSLYKLERKRQMKALLGKDWLFSISKNEPVIFCGDLNAGESSTTYHQLSRHLTDVQKATNDLNPPKPTFHSKTPVFRIDHIFVSEHFKPVKVEVKNNNNTRTASDHLPLVVDLRLKNPK
jgi:endonuclease/exonuclease/phosphatase family metal-dependent hydrolase